MRRYNLTDAQATMLARGAASLTVVKVLPEQPPVDWLKPDKYANKLHPDEYAMSGCMVDENGVGHSGTFTTKLPIPIGSTVGLTETWAEDEDGYHYKADNQDTKEEKLLRAIFGQPWLSPATMPSSAIRYRWTATESRVCKVQELGLIDIDAMGMFRQGVDEPLIEYIDLITDFKDWFNAHYAHPRPRRKNGKVIGYECWCWSEATFDDIWLKRHLVRYDERGETGLSYKGKGIVVHVNPWVEICVIKKGNDDRGGGE